MKCTSDEVKWTEETTRQLEVTLFVVNSVFCVCSNAFHIPIYVRQYSMLLGL